MDHARGGGADALGQLIDRHRDDLLRIALAPLSAEAARELGRALRGAAGGSAGAPDAAAASASDDRIDRAGGNPFFIAALTSHREEGSSPTDAVQGWINQTPRATADLLGVAAVVGSSFDLATLGALLDRPSADIGALLDPAVRGGLVVARGGGRFDFAHDLIRSALEDDLPSSLRRALHRDAAVVLRGARAEQSVIAHHLAQGARPGDEVAAEEIRQACLQIVRHDASTAADLLGTAVALCRVGSETWAAAISDRVIALQWGGHAVAALALANEAVAHPMPPTEVARVRIARAAALGLVNDLPASAEEYRGCWRRRRCRMRCGRRSRPSSRRSTHGASTGRLAGRERARRSSWRGRRVRSRPSSRPCARCRPHSSSTGRSTPPS